MSNASNALLVRVIRGELTESTHSGSIAVTDARGNLLVAVGNPQRVTYARSCAKPLQAVAVAESGAAERFGLTDRELAIVCASHEGEPGHVDAVQAILAKIGCDPAMLTCGVHPPFGRVAARELAAKGEAPTTLHNNCSGKHAGMLALAKHLGASTGGYADRRHPVQRRMLETVSSLAGLAPDRIVIGVDGCGVPVFGMPLARLAQAYARLGSGEGLPPARAAACSRIVGAMAAHPFEVAGTGRLDTDLIAATGGRVIGKLGAEGVYAATLPERGWGLALKIEDGGLRALDPAVVRALRLIGALDDEQAERLQTHAVPLLRNWSGTEIGRLEADFTLPERPS